MKRIITINKNIIDHHLTDAEKFKKVLQNKGIVAFNIMASPGAGKTSVIIELIKAYIEQYKIGVIEGDIVPIDVEKIRFLGIPVELAHRGGSCHLSLSLVKHAYDKLPHDINLLIIENVGNLICPSHIDLGTHANILIASVPEGDDKPYKYPEIFQTADIVVLNKIDYLTLSDFSISNFQKGVSMIHSQTRVFPISCKTKEGIDEFTKYLTETYMKYM